MIELDEPPISQIKRCNVIVRDVLRVEAACKDSPCLDGKPFAIRLQAFVAEDCRQRTGDPSRLQVRRRIGKRSDAQQAEFLPRLQDSVPNSVAFFPGPEDLEPNFTGHPVAQGTDPFPGALEICPAE